MRLHYYGGPADGLTVEYLPTFFPPRDGSYLTRRHGGGRGYYTSCQRWEDWRSNLDMIWTHSPPVNVRLPVVRSAGTA